MLLSCYTAFTKADLFAMYVHWLLISRRSPANTRRPRKGHTIHHPWLTPWLTRHTAPQRQAVLVHAAPERIFLINYIYMVILYNAIHDIIHHPVYGVREDYRILRKKEVMFMRSFLKMIDGANFRNGEIQSLVTLEWHAIRPRPKYHSNR